MGKRRRAAEVSCLDAVGRARAARIFPAAHGRVAIQAPPGEVIVVTIAQLQALWVTARDMCEVSWQAPGSVAARPVDPLGCVGSAA